MRRFLSVLRLLLFAFPLGFPVLAEPLFQWPFNEGSGAIARDDSGNGLDGAVTATWQTDAVGTRLPAKIGRAHV